MTKRWLFIICCTLIVVLLFLYVRLGYVYPKFIRVDRISLTNLHLQSPISFDINGELILKNPNPIRMGLRNIDFDVFINDHKITHIHQDTETKIPAMSEFSLLVNIPVTFKDNEFFSNIGSILINGITDSKLNIRFEGYLTVTGWGLEKKSLINYTYRYGSNSE